MEHAAPMKGVPTWLFVVAPLVYVGTWIAVAELLHLQ